MDRVHKKKKLTDQGDGITVRVEGKFGRKVYELDEPEEDNSLPKTSLADGFMVPKEKTEYLKAR